MDLLIVAVMLSPAAIAIVALTVVMARRDRAAGRGATRRISADAGYSREDVLRTQTGSAHLRVTGGQKGPFI